METISISTIPRAKHFRAPQSSPACPICSQQFFSPLSAISHLKTFHHALPKLSICMKCGICGKAFLDSSHLTSHILTHMKYFRKANTCRFCGIILLKMTPHTKQMHSRVECLKCGEEFQDVRQYDAHFMIAHEIEEESLNKRKQTGETKGIPDKPENAETNDD